MVGLVVVVILGIITITAGAATAREFFHKEIQTVELVRDWQKQSAVFWTEQNKIDSEVVKELADLWETVILLGDPLEILKEQKNGNVIGMLHIIILHLLFNENKHFGKRLRCICWVTQIFSDGLWFTARN